MQPVAGWLKLQVLLMLHGEQPFNSLKQVTVEWRNPWNSYSTLQIIGPVYFPGCYLPRHRDSACNTTVQFTLDTTQMLDKAGVPWDGITTLRVRAFSAPTPSCPAIFNQTLLSNATNATTGVVTSTPKQVVVLDAACDAHTAGFEAPIIVNTGGTFRGPLPAIPPFPVLGLSASGLPWSQSGLQTNAAINGLIPGWGLTTAQPDRYVNGNVTDTLLLPAYGATCIGSVGIANRIVMTDATFIPGPLKFTSIIEQNTTFRDEGDTAQNAVWMPSIKSSSSVSLSPALMGPGSDSVTGLARGLHKVTFRVDSIVRSTSEVFSVASGGMGSVPFNLTGVTPGANTAALLIVFNYNPL
jgi:hypothetical protein